MKTTILIPFFGRRPPEFEHFAYSASFVESAEFLFLTNDHAGARSYPNFKVIPFSLAQFNERAGRAIGCELNSENVAKICDFRPAFGLIFEDFLNDTDFWGYCDVDVLFGGISPYVSAAFLSDYDVVSMNLNYLSGSFTLWRNNAEINHLFEHSPDWKRLMSSSQHFAFDECGHGLWGALNSGASIFEVNCGFLSMTHVVRMLERDGKLRPHFRRLVKEVFEEGEVLRWSPGKVETVHPEGGAEYPYFHSVLLKNRPAFHMPSWNPMPAEIYISDSGYHRSLPSAMSRAVRTQRFVLKRVRRLPQGLMRRARKLAGTVAPRQVGQAW